MLIPTLLLLLPCLISANMWDNLHFGQGIPFQLPLNFSVLLSPTGFSNILKYSIHTNTDLNGISINTTAPVYSNDTVVSQMKFNFTTGTMTAYSEQRGCVIVKNSSMVYNNFYLALEGMLELALLLNSYDNVNNYKRVEITQLLQMMNVTGCVRNLALYFLDDWDLRIVESTFRNGNKSSFTIDKIGYNLTGLSEFEAQPQWQCKKMKVVQIKGQDYVVPDNGDDDKGNGDNGNDGNQSDSEYSDDDYQKLALKQESLEDVILDYLLPLNIDKNDRDAIHGFLEEIVMNYIGCSNNTSIDK